MSYEKFQHVINMLENDCPENNTDSATMEAFFDEVFTYIHANFVPPVDLVHPDGSDQLSKSRALLGDRINAHDNMKKIPPVLLEAVFPIAVASYFIWTKEETSCNKAYVDYRNLRTFDEFHNRYGALLLNTWTGSFSNESC